MRWGWIGAKSQWVAWRVLGIPLASTMFLLGYASLSVASEPSHTPKPGLPKRGISAHRGGLLGCPSNTIGAFQRAICLGVHQIELDVRTTANDVIVVAHDDHVTDVDGHMLRISESTLTEVHSLRFEACTGEEEKEGIPTLEEALAVMPKNIWINVDIKDNDPHIAKLVAETVAKVDRFDQVIFAARNKAVPAIRKVAKETGVQSWIANMSREIFRCQYIDATIDSCAEFIQLITVPYIPFIRGKPSQDTMDRLNDGGVRVNYSWLREDDEEELQQELHDLYDRGIAFVLVDHVEPAMNAADSLGIPPLIPRWDSSSLPPGMELPRCTPTP